MHATNNRIYVPNVDVKERDLTIEEVRELGKIVAVSDDGKRATVQVTVVTKGEYSVMTQKHTWETIKPVENVTVCYCGVTLDSDGKISEFIKESKPSKK